MNEVTKIHLGRQAYTISAEAFKSLRSYLDAITKQVGDKEVVDEVELRMAELLTERGVTGDKVILQTDVDFLKVQLGKPKDFKEEDEAPADIQPDTKRLFRDTQNGMVAGVAAGLSSYFGVDVLLVRIVFAVAAFTGGWGILLYVVLWLLVPKAKTSSDRLQMAGQPVTVNSLKEAVKHADLQGAAHRANTMVVGPVTSFFKLVAKLLGVTFIVAGLGIVFGLIGIGTYVMLHGHDVSQVNIFPFELREYILLDIGLVVIGIMALFMVLFGMAMFSRKWPIRGWITGLLVGLTVIGLAVGAAMAADVYPSVRDRYNANIHTTVRSVEPFTAVSFVGQAVRVNYQTSDTYSVSMHYYDHPDLSSIKTSVQNGTLVIDYSQFKWARDCPTFCIPNTYNMEITVSSPNSPQPVAPDLPISPLPPEPAYSR